MDDNLFGNLSYRFRFYHLRLFYECGFYPEDYPVGYFGPFELTGAEVKSSNQKMQELIGAMRYISDSSKQIDNVIKTIEDIAFQTNEESAAASEELSGQAQI